MEINDVTELKSIAEKNNEDFIWRRHTKYKNT